MNLHQSVAFATLALPVFTALTCSTGIVSGTSGSETGNGKICGCIVDVSGGRQSDVQVILLPKDYDPNKSSDPVLLDTTDTSGNYFFLCDPGSYTLQSIHLHDRTRAYSDSVIVAANETELPPDTLKIPGSITVSLPDDGSFQDGYFYIPGTTIYSFPDRTSGSAVLDSVPAARIAAVCYAETGSDEVRVIRNNVQVAAGGSVDILYAEWKYSRMIYLNTTSSGASIENNVTDFPVLLRLTRQNFTFGQSFGNGADLLFANSDGVPLPFEIERWDADSCIAEVWVKVDTVRANSDSQYITMFWGNPTVDNASNGATVFDTANGFQGVWHLNEDPSSGADALRDRTGNSGHGTLVGNDIRVVSGAVGRALEFGGEEAYVELPDATNLDYHGTITISCWVRFNENSPDSFNITGKYSFCEEAINECVITGYSLFCSSRRTIQLRVGFGTSLFFFLESDVRITDTGWHYIAGMFQSGVMTLFIDDKRKYCDFPETPVPSPEAGFIGGKSFFDGTASFTGEIDEVRIGSTARTPDWIRLNYLNQKNSDALVMWK
ncbi:MAG: DUF2341 domain-containing protein [Chitinispirillaceae bacterium]|nr:DUF2341 domain-containing protein [Chitinispirillaceae bacterium]